SLITEWWGKGFVTILNQQPGSTMNEESHTLTESDNSRTFPNTMAAIGIICLLYFFAGRAGLAVPYTSGNVSPVWPAAGLALWAFLTVGLRVWPGIVAGAFLVNLFTPIPHG